MHFQSSLLQLLSIPALFLTLTRALDNDATSKSQLPTVDLGYALQRAARFNSTGEYYTFSNIPFAEPPLGPLRFAAPIPPRTDRSVIRTGDSTKICPQGWPDWITTALNSTPPIDPRESEDCLYLDVHVPKKVFEQRQLKKVPVFLWIFGGGYTVGDKENSGTDVSGLIRKGNEEGGMIYVAISYRLGAFGWLSGPTIQASGGVSNAGLHDQRLALQWVQEQISKFGGDKDNVSISGLSSGAGSVMHQVTAYGGLKGKVPFKRVIPLSPGFGPVTSHYQQEAVLEQFLSELNVKTVEEARKLDTKTLQDANRKIIKASPYGLFTYGPTVDGQFVPDLPLSLIRAGFFDGGVDIMATDAEHDGDIFTPPFTNSSVFLANVHRVLPNISPAMTTLLTESFYPPAPNPPEYTTDFGRGALFFKEIAFSCNAAGMAAAGAGISKGHAGKRYKYGVLGPFAQHGVDSNFLFYNPDIPGAYPPFVNATVAAAVQEYIVTFATKGTPVSKTAGVSWEEYGGIGERKTLDWNPDGQNGFRMGTDLNGVERCDAVAKGLYF